MSWVTVSSWKTFTNHCKTCKMDPHWLWRLDLFCLRNYTFFPPERVLFKKSNTNYIFRQYLWAGLNLKPSQQKHGLWWKIKQVNTEPVQLQRGEDSREDMGHTRQMASVTYLNSDSLNWMDMLRSHLRLSSLSPPLEEEWKPSLANKGQRQFPQ